MVDTVSLWYAHTFKCVGLKPFLRKYERLSCSQIKQGYQYHNKYLRWLKAPIVSWALSTDVFRSETENSVSSGENNHRLKRFSFVFAKQNVRPKTLHTIVFCLEILFKAEDWAVFGSIAFLLGQSIFNAKIPFSTTAGCAFTLLDRMIALYASWPT